MDLVVFNQPVFLPRMSRNSHGEDALVEMRYFISDGLTCRSTVHVEPVGENEPSWLRRSVGRVGVGAHPRHRIRCPYSAESQFEFRVCGF